jgi:hypothetical protein
MTEATAASTELLAVTAEAPTGTAMTAATAAATDRLASRLADNLFIFYPCFYFLGAKLV